MKFTLSLLLVLFSGFSHALDITLEYCQKIRGGITDIEFYDSNKALITEKGGRLYYFETCEKSATEITRFSVDSRSELGLLGVAVPADRKTAYLYYAPKNDSHIFTRLSGFTLGDANGVPALEKEKVLLEIAQPYKNHDGGALKFGPDGFLYLGVGDGGSAGDPLDAGQDSKTLLGSIVRIQPALQTQKGYRVPKGNLADFQPGAQPEILAQGLRNPWKFSFDSRNNLIVADVGQNTWEEISIITAGAIAAKALNLGWRYKEGFACFKPRKDCDKPGLLEPVYVYDRSFGASITGGETLIVNDKEYYLFADFVSGKLAALDLSSPAKPAVEKSGYDNRWTTFGKSPDGTLYIADIKGNVYRIGLSQ